MLRHDPFAWVPSARGSSPGLADRSLRPATPVGRRLLHGRIFVWQKSAIQGRRRATRDPSVSMVEWGFKIVKSMEKWPFLPIWVAQSAKGPARAERLIGIQNLQIGQKVPKTPFLAILALFEVFWQKKIFQNFWKISLGPQGVRKTFFRQTFKLSRKLVKIE